MVELQKSEAQERTTKNDLGVAEMIRLVRESDVIDRTDGSVLAKAFNYLFDRYIEEPITKNYLGVSSGLEKNSKKLEKDFGELDCISREDALMCLTGEFEDRQYEPSELVSIFSKRIKHLPSVTPQEPVLDELRAEITTLQNRCYALTKGTMCAFCKYVCKYKANIEPQESEET